MILQGVEHDGTGLNDREDQRGEHDQTAGVQRKSKPQGGLQGIVRWSVPRDVHRRNTVQQLTFCCLLCVLKGSQIVWVAALGWFHRRDTLQVATFCCPSAVLTGSLAFQMSLTIGR